MAHTKAQRTVRGNRDSRSKRLGVKIFEGQLVKAGNIIIRQKGTKVKSGEGTLLSRDFTILATKEGRVEFYKKHHKQYVRVV